MTVCIAAICKISELDGGQYMVVGAADRKITAGDVQFEPPLPKIYQFSSHVVALMAGETDVQREICDNVRLKRPQPVSTKEFAEVYCRELGKYNRRQAERSVLHPFGLTMKSFLAGQSRLSPGFVKDLQYEIQKQRAELETIICGVDATGPHIYQIYDDGKSYVSDGVGFAAIGDGQWHAQSHYMVNRYTPHVSLPTALMTIYTAKKRAEVAPGVGTETDLFFIADRGFAFFYDKAVEAAKAAYESMRAAQDKSIADCYQLLSDSLERLVQQGEAAQNAAPASTAAQAQPPSGETTPKPNPPKRKRHKRSG